MVRVLEFGAQKYDAHNWKKGLPRTEIIDSMLRHIYAYLEGEDNDPESKIGHVGHILCNAMFLSAMHSRPDTDDRYKPNEEQEDMGASRNETSRVEVEEREEHFKQSRY